MHVSGNHSSAPRPAAAKPTPADKPLHLSEFRTGEKQALRAILDSPLPAESQVVGRCLADNVEIKTYSRETGLQRVDIKDKGTPREETLRTFHPQGAPAPESLRGNIAAVETRKHGPQGPQGYAPAVHTVRYDNGLRQTLAQAENGDLAWLGLGRDPAP